jgi:protein subunit release factor A
MTKPKIFLPELNEDLLAECEIQTFRSSGSGGQHINVTDSAVRLIHLPTRLVVTSQTYRSQYRNKEECVSKLRQLVDKLNYRKPKRIPTKIPYSVKKKNSVKKNQHSQKKMLRKRPVIE